MSVSITRDGHVAVVTFDRPPHNFADLALIDGIGAAFDAARYGIDETKARAPIWKAERFADGHVWIGEPARSGPADVRR